MDILASVCAKELIKEEFYSCGFVFDKNEQHIYIRISPGKYYCVADVLLGESHKEIKQVIGHIQKCPPNIIKRIYIYVNRIYNDEKAERLRLAAAI